jgi:site-specific DNA-methyltransferase (adenine-specific)
VLSDVLAGTDRWHIETGEVLAVLRSIPSGVAALCVTSPPYWRQRDYGVEGQLGHEPTLAAFVAGQVAVFNEVRRVLRPDGVLLVNYGDCWNGTGRAGGDYRNGCKREGQLPPPGRWDGSMKKKDLALAPAAVAQALRESGWWLRQEIIWAKGWASPGSAQDRPVTTHETVYLLAAGHRYRTHGANRYGSVWEISPARGAAGHHAAMPLELAARCVEIGSQPGDLVLDPFAGTGTTLVAALHSGRSAIGIDLNADFVDRARERIIATVPVHNRANQSELRHLLAM